jgi:hypothetical protein
MHNVIKTIIFTSFLFSAHNLKAEDSFSIGVGMGTLYSGLGTNLSLISENDMKYISAGCLSYGSTSGSTCGAGIGLIKTDLFEANTNKHGVGFYLGAVGTESNYADRDAIYGAGVGYHYFFNGIDQSGANIGLSLVYGVGDDENTSGIMVELGYQF